MRWWVAAVLVLGACPTVSAQGVAGDRPLALPTRDVDVMYRSEQAGQVIEQRSRFSAATRRLRLDTPTRGIYMIVDYGANTMAMVTDADHGVLEMPAPTGGLAGAGLTGSAVGQTFIRRGMQQIAGYGCTEWETKDNQNQAVLTCFTADGVLLSARRGPAVLAVATQVDYAPIDPALFEVPSGYQRLARRAP